MDAMHRAPTAAQEWRWRTSQADEVRRAYDEIRQASAPALEDGTAQAFMESLDPRSGVGARHHVVPRFLLERWASADGQVQVYSRIEAKLRTGNIRDLAIRDFYTFIDTDDERNSLLESLLSRVETDAATVIRRLLSPFVKPGPVLASDLGALAQFAAFQVVRTPRHRRELEIQADWYMKTIAQGRVAEEELAKLTIVPHQNDFVGLMGPAADQILPFLLARPLMLLTLDRPRLLIGDEPVIVNSSLRDVHHPDCFLTDDQIAVREAKELRKKAKRRRPVGRVIHITSTISRGLGMAIEVVLPISPRCALLWAPLEAVAFADGIRRSVLTAEESARFAELVNAAICNQALDWIIATPDDVEFATRAFPPVGPLLHVCDGKSAATDAVNETPAPMRPRRLTR